MTRIVITMLTISTTINSIAQSKNVVFVCEHGAAKSVIAPAYFNKMAKKRDLNYEAVCRGNVPDSTVSTSIETEDWSNLKNLDSDYKQRRDAIIKNINALLDTLSKQN